MNFKTPNTIMGIKAMRRKSKSELLKLINTHNGNIINDENYYNKLTLCDILNAQLLRVKE